MTKRFIATFYTNYGALCFYKKMRQGSIPAKMMPVPRQLSSSCGTCVSFENSHGDFTGEDMESLYEENNGAYSLIRSFA